MKVGLFVEGSTYEGDWLERIWLDLVLPKADLQHDVRVFGISKANIVSMDPSVRDLSSSVEPIDAMIARYTAHYGLEASVVAWDLIPKWNGSIRPCRWQETLDFYRFLSESTALSGIFSERAGSRFAELSSRGEPSDRKVLPALRAGDIIASIMDPMFEVILLDEGLIRTALGLSGERPRGWPKSRRWDSGRVGDPDKVLSEAISSASRMRPKPSIFRMIGNQFSVAKNEWGYAILSRIEDEDSGHLAKASIVSRLSDLR